MTTTKKYKHFVAILLMALYAFVATPVQFWHHHSYVAVGSSTTSDKKDSISFSEAADTSADGNCQICSHHYSTYNNVITEKSTDSILITSAKNGFYYSSILSTLFFNFSNKGPPALV